MVVSGSSPATPTSPFAGRAPASASDDGTGGAAVSVNSSQLVGADPRPEEPHRKPPPVLSASDKLNERVLELREEIYMLNGGFPLS